MTLVSYLRVSYIPEDANDNGHGGVHGWNAMLARRKPA